MNRKMIAMILCLVMATSVAMAGCQNGNDETLPTSSAPTGSSSTAAPQKEVSFTVRNQNDVIMEGVKVIIKNLADKSTQEVTVDATGTFQLTLTYSDYSVSYENLPENHIPGETTSFKVDKDTTAIALDVTDNSPTGAVDHPFFVGDEQIATKSYEAGQSLYFNFRGGEGRYILVENANVEVTCQGVTYKPDENGRVAFDVVVDNPKQVVSLQITNTAAEAQQITLSVQGLLGTGDNPYVVEALGQQAPVTVVVDGTVHYIWQVTETGRLTLKSDNTKANLSMTCAKHDELGNIISSVSSGFSGGDAAGVILDVEAGDVIMIQVSLVEGSTSDEEIVFELALAKA